mmetsp:Transcript_13739/g.51294  ORF Transcript_13739/g.51294 Transcript_13739/m.51294 type:complete len:214 (+) Transcript_13739:675-1316(+)
MVATRVSGFWASSPSVMCSAISGDKSVSNVVSNRWPGSEPGSRSGSGSGPGPGPERRSRSASRRGELGLWASSPILSPIWSRRESDRGGRSLGMLGLSPGPYFRMLATRLPGCRYSRGSETGSGESGTRPGSKVISYCASSSASASSFDSVVLAAGRSSRPWRCATPISPPRKPSSSLSSWAKPTPRPGASYPTAGVVGAEADLPAPPAVGSL